MAQNPYDIIYNVELTERTTNLQENLGQYSFKVATKANKIEIAKAIEKIFKVKVASVNTLNRRGKMKRVRYVAGMSPSHKRAIVTLKKGYTIEV